MNSSLELSEVSPEINWKRGIFLGLGLLLFVLLYLAPPMPDALDPAGTRFPLSREGKAALAIFLLAGIWWVFEVVPIGVTSLAIGLLQVVFLVRPAEEAFGDFMRPSVLFIFASIVIGQVFTKTGLTQRLAYRMLAVVGDRTSRIYLGCFIITSALTHIMAHTAVAATLFPLLMTIYAHYGEGQKQTLSARDSSSEWPMLQEREASLLCLVQHVELLPSGFFMTLPEKQSVSLN